MVQASGHLTVNTAPQFIKKLKVITIIESECVKLKFKVVGCPTPKVKWYKEEVLIKTDDKRLKYEE